MAIKKILLSCSVFSCFIQPGLAQTVDVTKNINTIKRDTTFIYAEATTKSKEEAVMAAKSILEVKVGDWVRSAHPAEGIEVCIAKAKEHCFDVQTRRGDYYRAFVYVCKNDIMPVVNKEEVVVFQVAPESEKPLSAPDDVISEEATAEPSVPTITLTPEEERMVTIKSFYDVEPYIVALRNKNGIEAYGKYATMPTDSACHLFVYDRKGQIRAVLRKTDSAQINLNTLKEDDIKNYKNCGAVWFQLKQH